MSLNILKPIKLNESTKFIFREGMLLRQWQVDKLFEFGTRPEVYPNILTYGHSGQIKGLSDTDVEVPYDALLFKMGCPILYNMYIKNPKQKISNSTISNLSDIEFRAGFFSGYLKHDSRGYYFDTNIRALLKIKEVS